MPSIILKVVNYTINITKLSGAVWPSGMKLIEIENHYQKVKDAVRKRRTSLT